MLELDGAPIDMRGKPARHGVPRGGCVDSFFEMYGDRILPSPGPFRTGLCFMAVIFCPEGVD